MADKEEIIIYIKRAFELKNQECYKQAIEMLYKAIAIEPDNVEILYQLGELYCLLNNFPRAIQYPERILSKDANHLPALKLLKDIYMKQNELCTAKEVMEKIYHLEENEQNLVSLIEIYGKLELFEEINNYSDKIYKSEKCLYAYANACYAIGDYDTSEGLIYKGLELNSESEDFKVLLGKIYYNKGEIEKAKDVFTNFDKNTQNSEILNFKGLFAMDEENFIDAIKFFSKASNIDKNNSQYIYNLANAYHLNGWYDEAISAYKKAIFIKPEDVEYRYSLAYVYFSNNDYDKAKTEIDYILRLDKNHVNSKVLKALLLLNDKNYIEAERLLISNMKDKNTDDFTLSSLSKVETELGKFELAKKYILEVINRNPNNLFYKSDLVNIYIKLKDYSSAISLADEIINFNENYIEGYILGAKAAYLSEKYNMTKNYAQNALSVDINCAAGYYYLALVRKYEQDYDEAIECMKRAITFDANNAEYYAQMADIYKLAGDNKTAFDYVKEAESIDDSEEYKLLFKEFAALNRK